MRTISIMRVANWPSVSCLVESLAKMVVPYWTKDFYKTTLNKCHDFPVKEIDICDYATKSFQLAW